MEKDRKARSEQPPPQDSRGGADPGRVWDTYVERWDPARLLKNHAESSEPSWPGDEWGAPKLWEKRHERLFVPAGVEHWRKAIEIGPGSGKFTLNVLGNPHVVVRGYDVSRRFKEVCEKRCEGAI